MDIVDDIRRHLYVRSRVTYRLEERGLRGHQFTDGGQFHLHCVLEGRCLYQKEGVPVPLDAAAGDVLILPRGGPVSVRDASDHRPRPIEHGLQHGLANNRHGTRGPRVIVLGGMLEFAGQTRHPREPRTQLVARAPG